MAGVHSRRDMSSVLESTRLDSDVTVSLAGSRSLAVFKSNSLGKTREERRTRSCTLSHVSAQRKYLCQIDGRIRSQNYVEQRK